MIFPLKIKKFIEENSLIEIERDAEIILKKAIPETALWSEKSFAKTWLNKREYVAWKDL